jgi:hypothetical protein
MLYAMFAVVLRAICSSAVLRLAWWIEESGGGSVGGGVVDTLIVVLVTWDSDG